MTEGGTTQPPTIAPRNFTQWACELIVHMLPWWIPLTLGLLKLAAVKAKAMVSNAEWDVAEAGMSFVWALLAFCVWVLTTTLSSQRLAFSSAKLAGDPHHRRLETIFCIVALVFTVLACGFTIDVRTSPLVLWINGVGLLLSGMYLLWGFLSEPKPNAPGQATRQE
jgi:hypothetical protein